MSEIQEAAPPDQHTPARHEAAEEKNCFEKFANKLEKIIMGNKQEWEVKRDTLDKMREWLMVLATLAVSIAYEAGLNPPGGFWQDNGNGHAAGTPVLQGTNHARYLTFYYFNAMSFVTSLVIIVLLMNKKVSVQTLVFATIFDLLSLVVAYIAGSTSDLLSSIGVIVIASVTFIYFARGILLIVCLAALAGLMGFVMCVVYNLCCCPCIIRILNMRSRKYQQRQQAIQDLTKRQRDQELAKNKEMLKRFNVPFTNSTPPAGSQVQVARPI